ncbi:HNH endonuclease signature motif containing protein [Zhongshania marina]|uniref:HNH endonuclease n=1 Tax=Zhongshania marina TaxID=2304603 RepID=A0A2S4HGH5_9GAMM|nr:HNH endonuclease signature motif containing protein [Marortus luteolus]POP53077.1 HNH endonuclease [Marortus luteolus]
MAWPYCYKWQQAAKGFLRRNPWCADHKARGVYVTATVVDHKVAHRGDMKLFWDKNNWQGLCGHCHDSHKQRLEKSGVQVGSDVNGFPLDPSHPWAKG